MDNFNIHKFFKDQYLNEGENDGIKVNLNDLTFDLVIDTFKDAYQDNPRNFTRKQPDGKEGTYYRNGISFPNSDDSLTQVGDLSSFENWKEKIIQSYGKVDIVLYPKADAWFNKVKIEDDEFKQDRENFSKSKAAWAEKEMAAGRSIDENHDCEKEHPGMSHDEYVKKQKDIDTIKMMHPKTDTKALRQIVKDLVAKKKKGVPPNARFTDIEEGTCGYTPDGKPRSKPTSPVGKGNKIEEYNENIDLERLGVGYATPKLKRGDEVDYLGRKAKVRSAKYNIYDKSFDYTVEYRDDNNQRTSADGVKDNDLKEWMGINVGGHPRGGTGPGKKVYTTDKESKLAQDKLKDIKKAFEKEKLKENTRTRELADSYSLAELKSRLAQIWREMEEEAEPEGGPVADQYADEIDAYEKAIRYKKGDSGREMTYGDMLHKTQPDKYGPGGTALNESEKSWNAVDVSRTAEKELSNKEWNERTAKKLEMLMKLNAAGKFKKDFDEERLQGWVDENYSWERVAQQFKLNESKNWSEKFKPLKEKLNNIEKSLSKTMKSSDRINREES